MHWKFWKGPRKHRYLPLAAVAALVLGAGAMASTQLSHGPASPHGGGGQRGEARADVKVSHSSVGSLLLAAVAEPSGFSAAGQTVSTDYQVTNETSQILGSVQISGTIAGIPVSVSCTGDVDELNPGQSTASCSLAGTTTQADVTAGSIETIATATAVPVSGNGNGNGNGDGGDNGNGNGNGNGDSGDNGNGNGNGENGNGENGNGNGGGTVTSNTVTTTTSLVPGPAVDLSTNVDPAGFSDAGQTLTYEYTVSNTGDAPLTGIDVSDTVNGTPVPADDVTCGDDSLGTGSGSVTCDATYTTTQADVSSGSVTNNAVVTADSTAPDGSPVTVTAKSSQTVSLIDAPDLSIDTSASASSFSQAGTPITYTYDVVNDGNTPVTGLGVTNSRGVSVNCDGVTSLQPGESVHCLGTDRSTAADVAAGHLSSTATARGRTPAGHTVEATDSLVIPLRHQAGISILMTASVGNFSQAGTGITYYYEVTNTGNVPLNAVTVTDSRLGPLSSCPQAELAPGARMICTAPYVTTAADVTRGSVGRGATVSGIAPSGRQVTASTVHVLALSRLRARVTPLLPVAAVTG